MEGKSKRKSVTYTSPQSHYSQSHSDNSMSPHTPKSFQTDKDDNPLHSSLHISTESQYTSVDILSPKLDTPQHQSQYDDTKQKSSDIQLKSVFHIQITHPEKHGEGIKDSYISYLIESKTVLDTYSKPESHVRRRYSDFVWLRNTLVSEYPTAIIPPLPDKLRLEYLDRFNSTFIEKRRLGLRRFLVRVVRHPFLYMSDSLRSFLELETLSINIYSESNGMLSKIVYEEGILAELFGRKIKSSDLRFEKIKQDMALLESEMKNAWKSRQKLIQLEKDSRTLMSKISKDMNTLSELWNNEELSEMFKKMSLLHDQLYTLQVFHVENSENNVQGLFKEPLNYLEEAKATLKYREHQQIEYELTLETLKETTKDHERLINIPFTKSNIMEYMNKKLDALRGIDQTTSRQDRLHRLEVELKDLTLESQEKENLLEENNESVLKEIDIFQMEQVLDIKESLIELASFHIEYHKECMKVWKEFISNS